MVSSLTPTERPTRRDPALGYFLDKYQGVSGWWDAAVELSNMSSRGVSLTRELVDYVATKHNLKAFDEWLAERTPKPAKPVPRSWVYFIRVSDRVKIGTSADPAQRAVALSLRVKDVHAVMEGDRKVEKALHAKFSEHRIDDTEWFMWCQEIEQFVASHADAFTRDHPAYKPGSTSTVRDGYAALARAIGVAGLDNRG